MSFLFGNKQPVYALAEVLEDGRTKTSQEFDKLKYKNKVYRGKEPMINIMVRVQPENEAPFEAQMDAGVGKAFLLMPGVRVQVKFEPGKEQHVMLEDEIQAILERNPQLIKKE
jgi:hypothetical protein